MEIFKTLYVFVVFVCVSISLFTLFTLDQLSHLIGSCHVIYEFKKKKFFLLSHYRPTPNEIFQLGKRVLVTGTTRTTNNYIFADMTVPGWDKDTMKYFTPYPECGGYKAGDWYLVGGESQMVGPICKSVFSN